MAVANGRLAHWCTLKRKAARRIDARGGEVQQTGGRQVVVAGADPRHWRSCQLGFWPFAIDPASSASACAFNTQPPAGIEPATSPFHRALVQSGLRERFYHQSYGVCVVTRYRESSDQLQGYLLGGRLNWFRLRHLSNSHDGRDPLI